MASAARVGLFLVVAMGSVGAAASGISACLADLPEGPPNAMTTAASLPVCGDGIVQRDAGEQCDPGDSGAAGCQTCRVSCPSDVGWMRGATQHCYFRMASVDPSADAGSSVCAAAGAHLVSFNGEPEHAAVEAHVDGDGPYWVALRMETMATASKMPIYQPLGVNEPGWRADCRGCYAASELHPANYFGDYCTTLRLSAGACVGDSAGSRIGADGGTFFGLPCSGQCGDGGSTALSSVLCEREPPGLSAVPCGDGGVCMTLATSSAGAANGVLPYYQLSRTQLSRDAAAAACAARTGPSGAAGHLVVFNDADEREELSRELSAQTSAGVPELDYWVGLAVRDDAEGFVWEDGQPESSYPSEWAEGEPTGSDRAAYSVVVQDGPSAPFDRQLLRSTTPNDLRPFVCEYE